VRADAAAQVLVADLDDPSLDDAQVHHLARSLRLRDAEQVVACDGAGRWRLCAWRPVGRHGTLEPTGDVVSDPDVGTTTTVWLPALKGARAEWAVTKLTELGVDRIGLLDCDRGVVRLDEATVTSVLARWARVAAEATCQSRRTRLPGLVGPRTVADLAAEGAVRCELDAQATVGDDCDSLAVGPEGGWSDAERVASPRSVRLAGTVLRTETAAVAAGVLLVASRSRHGRTSEAQ
jgi:16S rRNA (uracil1498-N3)-methyltransferase